MDIKLNYDIFRGSTTGLLIGLQALGARMRAQEGIEQGCIARCSWEIFGFNLRGSAPTAYPALPGASFFEKTERKNFNMNWSKAI